MSRLTSLWRNLVHRERVEQDLNDEVQVAFDLLVDEKVRAGMGMEDARRAARLEFGRVEIVMEQVRDIRAGAIADAIRQDLRYATRMLRRNPLFTITATLSLAIGIGANTTIFTVANGLLFRTPVGVTQPDRLVDIIDTQGGPGLQHSYPDYLDLRERATSLEGLYATQLVAEPMSMGGSSGAERVSGKGATVNYFTVLGVRPAVGRLFGAGDSEQPGASPIVVLSHNYWTRRFNNDSSIVGRTLELNNRPFTVVGVAPKGFQGTSVTTTDLWIPLGMLSGATNALSKRELTAFAISGRLKPGISVVQAAAELDTIGRGFDRDSANSNRNRRLRAVTSASIPGSVVVPVAGFLALLMGIVLLVLVIACSNLAGVLLARATARRREMAVRVAVGAGRARLVRQLLTETMMLFVLGGASGLLLARGMTSLLVSLLPALPVPIDVSLTLDIRILAFTIGLSLIAALSSGLAPALHASRIDVVSALKDESHDPKGHSRLRNGFVTAQVSVSILLVVSAGLLVRGLQRASSFDPGFDPKAVELVSLDLSLGGYTDATGPVFTRQLLDRIRQLPNVLGATVASTSQISDGIRSASLSVTGVVAANAEPSLYAEWAMAEPGYFAAMRIPLMKGRDFSAADRNGTQPVAIVAETVARRLWPGEDPIGKYFLLQEGRANRSNPIPSGARTAQVIGVARDLNDRGLGENTSRLVVYSPLEQQYSAQVTVVARTTQGQGATRDIRAVVTSINPNLPIVMTQTLEDRASLNLVPQRVAASVAGTLGVVGLLLAAIGVYGVTAYAVTRRTREIGIRLALGAGRAEVVGMVLRQGMSLVVIGSVIGLTLAMGVSRLLAGLLSGIPPLDPVAFGGSAMLFAIIGLAACFVPALRATRIEPMEALRYE